MIPILYEANETVFTSNGIGRLSDAISCKVLEERNGVYELEMQYHVDGIHYSDLAEERIIMAKPFDGGSNQAFRIYKITKPLNGIVTVYAEHISYLLNRMVVTPFTAGSCAGALAAIEGHFVVSSPFTFWTDKTVEATMTVTEPRLARELLGGGEGSITDIYGKGDYEFDNFVVKYHSHRGADNGVTFRYGKNITELENSRNIQNVYTGIVPFWKDSEDNVKLLPEFVVWSTHREDYSYPLIKIADFSSDYEEEPTEEQLRSRAESYLSKNSGWNPNDNIKVSFAALWQTEEYKDVANLERVKLCDTVHVVYNKLGVDTKMRVIKTDYNVLQEKYNSIEIGDSSSNNFVKDIAETDKTLDTIAKEQESELKKAIDRATQLIQGGLGGHIVFNTDANGHPNEILIMDTDNILTAVNVWRWNLNGLGHSHSGYAGPFDDVAITMDGAISANYITTGHMSANRIRAGVLQSVRTKPGTSTPITVYDLDDGSITSEDFTLYFGKSGVDDSTAGCYIGSDGFSFGKSGNYTAFKITPNGRAIANYLKFQNDSGVESSYGLWCDSRGRIASGGQVNFNTENLTNYKSIIGGDLDIGRNGKVVGSLEVGYNLSVSNDLSVSGSKNRVVQTDRFGEITLSAFETPTPMFADIGSGIIDISGRCYVWIDDMLKDSCADMAYQVLLQGIGGEVVLEEKEDLYFVVSGSPGRRFDWFITIPQRGYEDKRFAPYVSGYSETILFEDPSLVLLEDFSDADFSWDLLDILIS